jgi:hypothetical protein
VITMLRSVAFVLLAVVFITAFAVQKGHVTSPTEVVERLASRPEVASRFQNSDTGRFDATVFLFTCIILTPLLTVALILVLSIALMMLEGTVFQVSRRVGMPDKLTGAFVTVALVGFAWTYAEMWLPRSIRLLGTIARAWVVSTT